jgi:hypothetical protein
VCWRKKQIPRLRIAIGFANGNASLGMTNFYGVMTEI